MSGWLRGLLGNGRRAPQSAAVGTNINQPGQTVNGPQFFVENFSGTIDSGGIKIPPPIVRYPFRIDRKPQCDSLFKHFSAISPRGRSVCVIACGVEDELPHLIGSNLVEFLHSRLTKRFGLPDMIKSTSPPCHPLPEDCVDERDFWRLVGEKFLDVGALATTEEVCAALVNRAENSVFGFEIDVNSWPARASTIENWLSQFVQCRGSKGAVALAILIMRGPRSRAGQIDTLREELASKYGRSDSVVVLPVLAPVPYDHFKSWHQEFVAMAASVLGESGLATMALDLFPDDSVPLPMGKLWNHVDQAIRQAAARQ